MKCCCVVLWLFNYGEVVMVWQVEEAKEVNLDVSRLMEYFKYCACNGTVVVVVKEMVCIPKKGQQ